MSEGFVMLPHTAEIFFRYCIRYKINDEKEKISVMRRLVRKKQAEYLRDPEEYLKGKKVLRIRHKGDTNA